MKIFGIIYVEIQKRRRFFAAEEEIHMIEIPINPLIVDYSMQFKSICRGHGTGLRRELTQISALGGYIVEHQIQYYLHQELGKLIGPQQEDMIIKDFTWDIKSTNGHPGVPADKLRWTICDHSYFDPCDYYLFTLRQFYWDNGVFDAERSKLWIVGYMNSDEVMLCSYYNKGEVIDAYPSCPVADYDCYIVSANSVIPLDLGNLRSAFRLDLNSSLLLDE